MSNALSWRPVPRSLPTPVPWPAPTGVSAPAAGQPPLPWSATGEERATGTPGPPTARARTIRYGDSWADDLPDGVPDPAVWAGRIAGALVEVLQGRRPLGQLNRWLDAPVLARLAWMARRPVGPATLGTVHLNRAGSRAVEVVAVVHPPGRPGAAVSTIAFRLQVLRDRWLCTALELLPAAGGSAPGVGSGHGREVGPAD